MTTIFPQLERQLGAAAGQSLGVERRHGDRLRLRLAAPTVMIALLVGGGTAIAVTQAWDPIFGSDEHPVSTADTAAPSPQAAAVSVLRRAPTDADRGADVQATLRRLDGRLSAGVYPETIRKLGDAAPGQAVILFVSQRFGDTDQGRPAGPEVRDPLCVIYPDFASAVTPGCWTVSQIEAGTANTVSNTPQGSYRIFGLVPDRVARVRIETTGGEVIERDVRENFFDLEMPPGNRIPLGRDVVWLSSQGAIVEHQ